MNHNPHRHTVHCIYSIFQPLYAQFENVQYCPLISIISVYSVTLCLTQHLYTVQSLEKVNLLFMVTQVTSWSLNCNALRSNAPVF